MRILLFSVSLFFSLNANAQFNIDLERIDSLTKNHQNLDFNFANLKTTFEESPDKLTPHQVQILYYQSLNNKGSLWYELNTATSFTKFKELNFKKFVEYAEKSLQETPANFTILFLLSLSYSTSKQDKNIANKYAKKYKIVIDALMMNRNLKDPENTIELNCSTDEMMLLSLFGIDKSVYIKSTTATIKYLLNMYQNGNEKFYIKTLYKYNL